jgi:hypothetical protein
MLVPRPLLLPLVSALALAGCEFEVPPAHTYVVSRVAVPASLAEATAFGMDLDGDGQVDNQLGRLVAALSNLGVDLQAVVSGGIDRGTPILLLNLRTSSFSSTGDARAEVRIGDPASAVPQPCAGPDDVLCRRHLDGTGTFRIAAGSREDVALTGKISSGTFEGGPGAVSLEVSFGGLATVPLQLIGARTRATGLGEDKIDRAIIAGGLTVDRFDTHVIPAIREQINRLVRVSCPGTTPPDCGCGLGPSKSRALLIAFDGSPRDCSVSADEIRNNVAVRAVVGPDVTIGSEPTLSAGLEIQAVSAQF